MSLRTRVIRRVVSQFHQPHGLGGHLAGWVMSQRASNRRRNRWVVELLEVQPTDRVLEIGVGPGIAIRELSRLATDGHVYGIDHSAVMVRQATRRNVAAVRAGQVELRVAAVEDLPAFGDALDKIVAVNSMGFWSEPELRLLHLRSRLNPGGKIAVASQPRCPGATAETSIRAAGEIERALRKAGFLRIRVETLDLDPPVVCVLGING